ncbi:hypothetical protein TanjilG_08584 [Lupinus angustifolius]|uniref:Reverse transcriptase Ty1/copia-type domain-containing protein n=1 Tax=Lupinus angustifolius TaxID=3871 RepID=A0A4P1RPJ9_LUPAN|nr:hypothetical protein TanjilG_08584 [Lupinus angustifolius]
MNEFHDGGHGFLAQELDFKLVPLLQDECIFGYKEVYKQEPAISGKDEEKFKACLGAKGYSQQQRINYNEIFSSVVKHTSIMAVLSLIARWKRNMTWPYSLCLMRHRITEKSMRWVWWQPWSWVNTLSKIQQFGPWTFRVTKWVGVISYKYVFCKSRCINPIL